MPEYSMTIGNGNDELASTVTQLVDSVTESSIETKKKQLEKMVENCFDNTNPVSEDDDLDITGTIWHAKTIKFNLAENKILTLPLILFISTNFLSIKTAVIDFSCGINGTNFFMNQQQNKAKFNLHLEESNAKVLTKFFENESFEHS